MYIVFTNYCLSVLRYQYRKYLLVVDYYHNISDLLKIKVIDYTTD